MIPVGVVPKDFRPLDSSDDEVVDSTRIIDPCFPGHKNTLSPPTALSTYNFMDVPQSPLGVTQFFRDGGLRNLQNGAPGSPTGHAWALMEGPRSLIPRCSDALRGIPRGQGSP